jgi:predicted sugar kinase
LSESIFRTAQGGVFTSRRVAHVIAQLEAAGASGIGQSSWGPTGFAFAPSQEAALAFVSAVEPDGIQFRIVRGRNDGATIELTGLDLVAN